MSAKYNKDHLKNKIIEFWEKALVLDPFGRCVGSYRIVKFRRYPKCLEVNTEQGFFVQPTYNRKSINRGKHWDRKFNHSRRPLVQGVSTEAGLACGLKER